MRLNLRHTKYKLEYSLDLNFLNPNVMKTMYLITIQYYIRYFDCTKE